MHPLFYSTHHAIQHKQPVHNKQNQQNNPPLPLLTHCNYLPCNARHGSFLDIPAQTSHPASMIADIFLAGVGGFAGSALRCTAGVRSTSLKERIYKNYEQMKRKADSHFPDDTEVRG